MLNRSCAIGNRKRVEAAGSTADEACTEPGTAPYMLHPCQKTHSPRRTRMIVSRLRP